MPPPANAGTRGGLITAVVIFAILFVTATIFAIYYGTQAAKAQEDLQVTRMETTPAIVRDTSLNHPQLAPLDAARKSTDPAVMVPGVTGTTPLMDVALAQRDMLARMLAGGDYTAARARIPQVAQAIRSQVAPEGGKAIANVNTSADMATLAQELAAAVVAKQEQASQLERQVASTRQSMMQQAEAHQAEMARKDQQIAEIRNTADQQIGQAQQVATGTRTTVQQIEQTASDERARLQQAMDQMNVQMAQRDQRVAEQGKEIEALRRRLAPLRIDSKEPTLRQADGQIISIPGNQMVYIDLGQGDQLVPGMTFEVYDKLDGMPRSADKDEAGDPILPKGKASIEVVNVGATSSEARVIRQDTGVVITQGDLIANIVYDKNTKYQFVVYGKFDLDRNGQAISQDAEVIKRLITQWGGQLMDRVTVDTDFVVLGVEPTIPEFTREELQDPPNMAKRDAAQRELDEYLNVSTRAAELSIPVLNQNRFLYFVGYYNQARR